MIPKTNFRAPHNNARYTQQLFYEMNMDLPIDRRTIEPIFSLNVDVPGLINFRTEYVNDMDPTGYKTGSRLLENYAHFQLLMRSKWFRDCKEEWDKEIAAKIEMEALEKLRTILNAPEADLKPSERISAAKALLTRADGLKGLSGPQKANKRGRPSKEEVQGALAEEIRLTKEEQEDLSRILPFTASKG